jgi:hypothetical protein
MLHRQHSIHALDAQTSLLIQKIGDMRLLEAGLLGQPQAGQIAFFNPPPKSFPQIILQYSEFHAGSIAPSYIPALTPKDFHSLFGIATLTEKIHSYTITTSYNQNPSLPQGLVSMSTGDSCNEEKNFVEFRRKMRAAEVLSAAMERLLLSLRFTGRVSVVLQNGRVLKAGYEEGYFRQGKGSSATGFGEP